jgi:outer membrane murein-binding lipoprotein Lpp
MVTIRNLGIATVVLSSVLYSGCSRSTRNDLNSYFQESSKRIEQDVRDTGRALNSGLMHADLAARRAMKGAGQKAEDAAQGARREVKRLNQKPLDPGAQRATNASRTSKN